MFLLASCVVVGLVPIAPLSVGRLTLPSYSSEHCLLLKRSDVPSSGEAVLPVLLRYSEGERLMQALAENSCTASTGVPLGVEIAVRRGLFEAASGQSLAPWSLLRVGDGCSTLYEALARFLAKEDLTPTALVLSLESQLYTGNTGFARYREEVSAPPDAQRGPPSSPPLRLGELVATLQCSRCPEGSASDTGGDDAITIELDGPGEAVLMSREGELPLLLSETVWQARAAANAEGSLPAMDVVVQAV